MTVAIAAINVPGYVVTVSDQLVSFDDIIPSTDGVLKGRKLARGWGTLFAADDANRFFPLVSRIYEKLPREHPRYSYEEVKTALVEAFSDEHDEMFVNAYLRPLGYSSKQELRREARNELPTEKYNALLEQMARLDLGIELLAYGFGKNLDPHLIGVCSPGVPTDYRLLGYAAIGSGATVARASLAQKPLTNDLNDTIYRLLTAKFLAEKTGRVGKGTHLITMHASGNAFFMPDESIEEVRAAWIEETSRPSPTKALDAVSFLSLGRTYNEERKAADEALATALTQGKGLDEPPLAGLLAPPGDT